jgi:hypothetical protein
MKRSRQIGGYDSEVINPQNRYEIRGERRDLLSNQRGLVCVVNTCPRGTRFRMNDILW